MLSEESLSNDLLWKLSSISELRNKLQFDITGVSIISNVCPSDGLLVMADDNILHFFLSGDEFYREKVELQILSSSMCMFYLFINPH